MVVRFRSPDARSRRLSWEHGRYQRHHAGVFAAVTPGDELLRRHEPSRSLDSHPAGRVRRLRAHAEDRDVLAQPGVNWQELNSQLESQGLLFPIHPGPGARIGVMVRPCDGHVSVYEEGEVSNAELLTR